MFDAQYYKSRMPKIEGWTAGLTCIYIQLQTCHVLLFDTDCRCLCGKALDTKTQIRVNVWIVQWDESDHCREVAVSEGLTVH